MVNQLNFRLFTLFLPAILVWACEQTPKKEKPITLIIPQVVKAPAPESLKEIRNVITHPFSDPEKLDTFKITLAGKSVLEGEVTFQIVAFDGRMIYEEKFPATYLIGYELDGTASVQEQEAFIRKRIREFFSQENFADRAIAEADSLDNEYVEPADWNTIKKDSTAVGFFYIIADENLRSIAYSKEFRKVVTYNACC